MSMAILMNVWFSLSAGAVLLYGVWLMMPRHSPSTNPNDPENWPRWKRRQVQQMLTGMRPVPVRRGPRLPRWVKWWLILSAVIYVWIVVASRM